MRSPAAGRLTSTYGRRQAIYDAAGRLVAPAMFHAGVDVANDVGTPVIAAFPGRVIRAGWDVVKDRTGRAVLMEHTPGPTVPRFTYYGHLDAIAVAVGEHLPAGGDVGPMGATGRVTASHLHFETWPATFAVTRDPLDYFRAHGITPGAPTTKEDDMTPEQAWTLTNVSNAVKAIREQTWKLNRVMETLVLPALRDLGADVDELGELATPDVEAFASELVELVAPALSARVVELAAVQPLDLDDVHGSVVDAVREAFAKAGAR